MKKRFLHFCMAIIAMIALTSLTFSSSWAQGGVKIVEQNVSGNVYKLVFQFKVPTNISAFSVIFSFDNSVVKPVKNFAPYDDVVVVDGGTSALDVFQNLSSMSPVSCKWRIIGSRTAFKYDMMALPPGVTSNTNLVNIFAFYFSLQPGKSISDINPSTFRFEDFSVPGPFSPWNGVPGTEYGITLGEQGVTTYYYGTDNPTRPNTIEIDYPFADTTPPTVTSVSPSGTGIAVSGNIVITFSEAMDTGTAGTVQLNGLPALTGGAWNSPTNTVFTIPYSGLANSTAYTVNIFGFKDVAGNMMANNSANTFTTEATPPTPITFTATQTGGISSESNTTGIQITFNTAVTGLAKSNITITNGTGMIVHGTLSSSSSTTYTVAVSSVTMQGNVTVSVANFGTYVVTTTPQTVAVYKDTTAPTVTSVSPSGTGVAVSGNIVITFNEAMNPTAGTVQLNTLAALTGGTWSVGNTVYTVAYSGLVNSTSYTVRISGFKDVAGNTMTADNTNSFTTVGTSRTFTAVQTGGTSNTVNTTGIQITFNTSVTGLAISDITITNGTGSIVKGTTLSGSGTTYTIAVTSVAAEGNVTVSIANFGTYVVTTTSQTVAVYKDTTAPTVTSVSPSGSTVAVSGNIVITFNEAMDTGTAGTVQLNSLPALAAGTWNAGKTVYTVAYSGLDNSTPYTVNISGFKDAAGNTMTADTKSFTTVGPSITFTAVQTGGTSNTVNTTGIQITFNTAVTGLAISNISIENGTGVIGIGTLSGSGTTYTVAVTSVNTQGNVTVKVANFGTYIVTTTQQTVAVYKDNTRPSVTSVSPSGLGVAVSGNVVITFNEAMNPTVGTVQLGSLPLGAGTWSTGNTVYTVAYSGLANSTTYTVNISSFRDVTGNTMQNNSANTFTTEAAAVTWSGLSANGTLNTATTTALTLTFSVDPTTLAASNITVTGATKGTLSGSGTTRTLTISNITVANGANVTVSITNPAGFTITPTSMTVAVNKDITAPTLSAGSVNRTSATAATIGFTTNEAGTAYYLVRNIGDAVPGSTAVKAGTSLGAVTAGAISGKAVTLTTGPKVIYVVVEDAAGNLSDVLPITATADIGTGISVVQSGTLTYNGSPQTPTFTVTLGGTTLTPGTDYNITVDTPQTNAGTYTATITGSGNYLGTTTGSYTIGKAPVTVAQGSYNVTKAYDGNQSAGTVSGTLNVTGLVDGTTVIATPGTYPSANAGTHSVTITLALSNTANHALVNSTLVIPNATITKVPYTGTVTATANVRETGSTGNTVMLPALPLGASYAATGTIGGTVALISGTPAISNTTLTFDATAHTAGTSATITINVTGATNYNDYSVEVTVTSQAVVKENKPVAAIDFVNEMIINLEAGAVYTVNGTSITANASGKIPIQAGWVGTSIDIVKVGVGGNNPSDPQTLVIPGQPAAPTTIGKTDTSNGLSNGEITGVDGTMEYKLSTSSTWTTVTGTTITGLGARTYQVRVKATAYDFASPAVIVTIAGSTPLITGTAPKITGLTSLKLKTGYAKTSIDTYEITGSSPVTVTILSDDAKITWNRDIGTLDIAEGLPVGKYTVKLQAQNSAGSASLTIILTVEDQVFWMESGTYSGGKITVIPPYVGKEGELVTLTVIPDVGYKLESIQIVDYNNSSIIIPLTHTGNTYTFTMPAHHIRVVAVFGIALSVEDVQTGLKAFVQNGVLQVNGLSAGKTWSVYNMLGTLIYQAVANSDYAEIGLPGRGIYIVSDGNRVIKVNN